LDALAAQPLERSGIRSHPLIRPHPDDEARRQLVDDLFEVLPDELVAVAAPPVLEDAVGQDDHIAGEFTTLDRHLSEAISRDTRHDLTRRGATTVRPWTGCSRTSWLRTRPRSEWPRPCRGGTEHLPGRTPSRGGRRRCRSGARRVRAPGSRRP